MKILAVKFKPTERIIRSIAALKDAIGRFESCRISKNPADSFAPLVEALSWITALDRNLDKAWPEYRRVRDKDKFGKLILGHRFARNQIEHDNKILDLVDIVSGAHFPIQYPATFFELKWKILAVLPELKSSKQALTDSYVKYVAGCLVRETFRKGLNFFVKICGACEPVQND